jgi:hypothetical protein
VPKRPPLDGPAVKAAIERSGYSFELDVLNRLYEEGLDPTPGFRLRVADGIGRPSKGDDPGPGSSVTREIDVMARINVGHPISLGESSDGPAGIVVLHVLLLIETKVLPEGWAFVGFQTPHFSSVAFTRAGALCGVPGGGDAWNLLSGAFAPMSQAPHCVQWATVEPLGDDSYKADHDNKYAAAISHLVRAQGIYAQEATDHLMRNDSGNARVNLVQPMIVAKTRALYLYDTSTGQLTETPRLSLAQYVERHDGSTTAQIIDVITSDDLPAFAQRMREVKANLETSFQHVARQLLAGAFSERSEFAKTEGARIRRQILGDDWRRGEG